MVEADLDNTAELVKAFRGAHAIFCVTNFWQELGVPSNWAKAAQTGQDIRKICYDIELQRGKNMIDVASTADKDGILEHLVLSVVPSSLEQSGGKIKGNYHFDAKWAWVCINSCVVVDSAELSGNKVPYLRDAHSHLVAKTSLYQPGIFLNNWDAEEHNPLVKVSTFCLPKVVNSN